MSIEDLVFLEGVNAKTGSVTTFGKLNIVDVLHLKIPKDAVYKKNQFLISGASCNDLNINQLGALLRICHTFLHFDTLLLHKKDRLGNMVRIKKNDLMDVLGLKIKTTGKIVNELVRLGALIKPNTKYRFFVNPKFIIRGGYISCEEFNMLSRVNNDLKDCLDDIQRKNFINWKILAKQKV